MTGKCPCGFKTKTKNKAITAVISPVISIITAHSRMVKGGGDNVRVCRKAGFPFEHVCRRRDANAQCDGVAHVAAWERNVQSGWLFRARQSLWIVPIYLDSVHAAFSIATFLLFQKTRASPLCSSPRCLSEDRVPSAISVFTWSSRLSLALCVSRLRATRHRQRTRCRLLTIWTLVSTLSWC